VLCETEGSASGNKLGNVPILRSGTGSWVLSG